MRLDSTGPQRWVGALVPENLIHTAVESALGLNNQLNQQLT